MRKFFALLIIFLSFHVSAEAKHSSCAFISSENIVEKILLITLDEIGTIKVNNDPVGSDALANYIQERLFKSYLGTGEMHSKIKLVKTSADVPDMVSEAVIKEIKDGQHKALVSVCLQKYKKTFDILDKKKQEKLEKQFPVLFQTDFN